METLQEWLNRTAKARQQACKAERKSIRANAKQAAKNAAWWAEFKAKQAAKK